MAPKPTYAVDTSVAVAALDAAHTAHAWCRDAVVTHRPALAGHAAYETYSVLTRMPGDLAVDPPDAAAIPRMATKGYNFLEVMRLSRGNYCLLLFV